LRKESSVDKLAEDLETVTLRLSKWEFRVVGNSLNEVTHGIHIPESEFSDRLGGPRSETKRLLDVTGEAVDTSGLEPNRGISDAIGPEGVSIQLAVTDLPVIRNALFETTKGVEISPEDFISRVGDEPGDVERAKVLLGEFDQLIEAL
jgi:hypothetical protein